MADANELLVLAQAGVREIVPDADLTAMAVCFNLIRSAERVSATWRACTARWVGHGLDFVWCFGSRFSVHSNLVRSRCGFGPLGRVFRVCSTRWSATGSSPAPAPGVTEGLSPLS